MDGWGDAEARTWLAMDLLAPVHELWALEVVPGPGGEAPPVVQALFKTTRNRIGFASALSPVMLFQNYHLVHHLHPRIPFHRYVAAWRRNEQEYLTHEPPLTDVRGRPLTTDQYRARRGLAVDAAPSRNAS